MAHPYTLLALLTSAKKLLLVGMVLFIIPACAPQLASQLHNTKAPNTSFYFINGKQETLEWYSGQKVTLLFWSRTCRASVRGLKSFASMSRAARENGIQSIAISVDRNEDYDIVQQIIKSLPANNIKHAFSGNDIYDEAYIKFLVDMTPQFFALDREHNVMAVSTSISDIEAAYGL